MKALIATMCVVLSTSAMAASKDTENTDPRAIQAFLADPQTHSYNMHDPVGWAWYRKVLQTGTRSMNGTCRYPMTVSTTGDYASFATEIAVNHARCQSLILEGNPAPARTVQTAMTKTSSAAAQARPAANRRP